MDVFALQVRIYGSFKVNLTKEQFKNHLILKGLTIVKLG